MNQDDLTRCYPGQVWDWKRHVCLQRHSGVLPDWELTEYAYALAKADRFQEPIYGLRHDSRASGEYARRLKDVGRPVAGETVVVSGAAGATGSVVCRSPRSGAAAQSASRAAQRNAAG